MRGAVVVLIWERPGKMRFGWGSVPRLILFALLRLWGFPVPQVLLRHRDFGHLQRGVLGRCRSPVAPAAVLRGPQVAARGPSTERLLFGGLDHEIRVFVWQNLHRGRDGLNGVFAAGLVVLVGVDGSA